MIRPRDEHLGEQRGAKPREPIVLSPAYLAAIREVEALRCNQDGADKSWVHRAMEEMQRHFASVKRD